MFLFRVFCSVLLTPSQLQIYAYFLIIKNKNRLFYTQFSLQPLIFSLNIPKYSVIEYSIYPHLAIVHLGVMRYLCSEKNRKIWRGFRDT